MLEIQKNGRIRFMQGALPTASVVPSLLIAVAAHQVWWTLCS